MASPMLKGADIRFGIAVHMMDPLGLNVRRQGFWNQRQFKLRESLTHLVLPRLVSSWLFRQSKTAQCPQRLIDPELAQHRLQPLYRRSGRGRVGWAGQGWYPLD